MARLKLGPKTPRKMKDRRKKAERAVWEAYNSNHPERVARKYGFTLGQMKKQAVAMGIRHDCFEGLAMEYMSSWSSNLCVSNPAKLLRVVAEEMPDDATICFEGPSDWVVRMLRRRAIRRPPILRRDTLDPLQIMLHVPLRDARLQEIATLASQRRYFDATFHIQVYRPGKVLLTAHDMCCPLCVSPSIGTDRVRRIFRRLRLPMIPLRRRKVGGG